MNEIHGSWFDPSNPDVKYHGTLAAANLRAMDAAIARDDLALVIGTSLSGLNANRVATETASKLDAKLAMGAVGEVQPHVSPRVSREPPPVAVVRNQRSRRRRVSDHGPDQGPRR